jgi:hypothetical protein
MGKPKRIIVQRYTALTLGGVSASGRPPLDGGPKSGIRTTP